MRTQEQNRRIIIVARIIVIGLVLLLWTPGPGRAQQTYEAYYRYLGNYPSEANPGWHENVQGLAHDQDNWFITQTGRLWRIPVTHDLNRVSCSDPGVVCRTFDDWSRLASEGYNHLGDPDYFESGGQGYVLVPVTGGPQPAIAVFRANDLQYIDHAYLTRQSYAGWCAVDPQGNVYSQSLYDAALDKFSVDWSALRNNNTLILSAPTSVSLFDETGFLVAIERMQGGEISPSGQLLYLVAGYFEDPRSTDGIHVFDLSTGKRVQRSTNGSGLFNYEFHSGGLEQEEPEGLTIWDLDDGRAPGIRGQLHVLLLDNDAPDADDVYLKHYTHTIYVDRSYAGVERGTFSNPFNTVVEANNFAWNGAWIKIQAGSYRETLTFSKRVILLASGGTVTIGQ